MKHAFFQCIKIQSDSRFANNNDQVQRIRNFLGMPPDNFLQKPPHSIANNSIPDFAARRNPHPEPFIARLRQHIQNKLTIGKRLTVPVNPAEISPIRKTKLFLHLSFLSGKKFLTIPYSFSMVMTLPV
jgi:hypothetical protein